MTTGCCRGLSAKDCIRLYPNGCSDEDRDNYRPPKSWYCNSCAVEVYGLRCKHCGKTKRERT